MRKRKATRSQRRTLGSLAFVAAFGLGLAAGSSGQSTIRQLLDGSGGRVDQIEVLGHTRLDAREIAAHSGIAPGSTTHDVDLAASAERLRSHPWLRDARLLYGANASVLIIVEEREPAALLHSATLDEWRVVERDGTTFVSADPRNWPELLRLRASADFSVDAPQPSVAQALLLAQRIAAHGIPRPAAIRLPADSVDSAEAGLGWRLTLADSGPEIVLGREPGDQQIARLAELLRARPAAVRSAEQIDMRFEDRAILRAARTIPAERRPGAAAAPPALAAWLGGRPASG